MKRGNLNDGLAALIRNAPGAGGGHPVARRGVCAADSAGSGLCTIPHDLRILKEVFRLDAGGYARSNAYWTSADLVDLIGACGAEKRSAFLSRVDALKGVYAEMSDIYQANKTDTEIPLK